MINYYIPGTFLAHTFLVPDLGVKIYKEAAEFKSQRLKVAHLGFQLRSVWFQI